MFAWFLSYRKSGYIKPLTLESRSVLIISVQATCSKLFFFIKVEICSQSQTFIVRGVATYTLNSPIPIAVDIVSDRSVNYLIS